ncbi:hypothetical protein QMO56_06940 [Roseomonas sp. E05]|uniref:hypothetical protein n=1 Tax=Roseomonas sp. E05 TaxID=3046310 RepID=UPI0024BB16A4|nr:hypothetical protein [Roseomonas sp. E05]MDJ0387845.1 hypothetical protein [Roseomonas sp. E05]
MRISHALIGGLGLVLAACGPMRPGGGSGPAAPTGASGMSTTGSSTSSIAPIQGQNDVGPSTVTGR